MMRDAREDTSDRGFRDGVKACVLFKLEGRNFGHTVKCNEEHTHRWWRKRKKKREEEDGWTDGRIKRMAMMKQKVQTFSYCVLFRILEWWDGKKRGIHIHKTHEWEDSRLSILSREKSFQLPNWTTLSLTLYTQETSKLIKGESQEWARERGREEDERNKRKREGGSRKREEKLMSNKRGEWLFLPFSLSSPCPSHFFQVKRRKDRSSSSSPSSSTFSYRHSWMELSFFHSFLSLTFILSLSLSLILQLIQENFPESQDCLKMRKEEEEEDWIFLSLGEIKNDRERESQESGIFVPKLGHEPSVTG